ncbi:hypothetical protein EDD63_11126 [Breznakia blatticola]|uniref:Uncharacterized protein n=1 Tax=Breznakia blatticola TaxID=1754012 RepID=A0A4V3G7W4_9FIRM|nr:hypothetical protein [Breznakia blatticola]TDW20614.1 hypothetical protein EDD63_11126 [Breznakia blatticola]
MKRNKLVVACVMLVGIGLVSQVVERNLDKPAIQKYVETSFKETDDDKDTFDFKDEKETNIFEWIGF